MSERIGTCFGCDGCDKGIIRPDFMGDTYPLGSCLCQAGHVLCAECSRLPMCPACNPEWKVIDNNNREETDDAERN